MAGPALTKHLVVIQYKPGKFDPSGKVLPGQDGVNASVEHVHGDVGLGQFELPVKGCIDYEVKNEGSAIAYLYDGAIVILPGQSWTPAKSTPLPLINQPKVTFQGDYQMSRNANDLVSPPPAA